MPKRRQARSVSTASSTADPVVLYIHGIGAHPPKADLKLEWDLALFGRDRGPATRMAYWSDIVHPGASTRAKSIRARAAAERPKSVDELIDDAGIDATDQARTFVAALHASLTLGETSSRGTPGKKVLPLPGFLRRPISRAFVNAFIADTAAYFFNQDNRTRIKRRLTDEMPLAPAPIVLVAHSQGSVVALEVLSALGAKVNVLRLVTIGSPLGIQEVQDFLDVKKTQGGNSVIPPNVDRWFNFADPFDPVALDKGLAGDFVAAPRAAGALPVAIVDDVIVNPRSRQLTQFNPHSAAGYLAHPKVRRTVYDVIQHDLRAPFVVARDVAESLAADQRVPLLIEVLEPGYSALGEDDADRLKREDAERRRYGTGAAQPPLLLADRIAVAATKVEALVKATAKRLGENEKQAVADARIDVLRRFVAAHLTPVEIQEIARAHISFNLYAVWRSTAKSKLISRSRAVMQADAALESYRANGHGITWAVLDTGVRSDHPHFNHKRKGKPDLKTITEIWDCTKPGRPRRLASDTDRDGHGSHVAGIIAGHDETDPDLKGVAPYAKLVVYKVLDDDGNGEDAWIIKALDHVAESNENKATMAVHGLNLSLGGPYDSSVYGCGFTPICQELRRLWRSGVLVVVASGNEGQLEVQTQDGEVEINTPMSIGDPANLEDCIAVGSVHADKPHLYGVSAFSSRGPTSDGRCKPDVVAPGERIRSVNSRVTDPKSPNRYRAESGTSMAAPHVSGLLAAFLSVRREFRGRPDEVKKVLMDTCTDIGRDRQFQGKGIPNLMKMLLSV